MSEAFTPIQVTEWVDMMLSYPAINVGETRELLQKMVDSHEALREQLTKALKPKRKTTCSRCNGKGRENRHHWTGPYKGKCSECGGSGEIELQD